MSKVTFKKVYHIFKSPSGEWEMEDVEDYFESCSDQMYDDVDYYVYEYEFNLKEQFIEKFGGKEGYVFYYAEFNIHGFVSRSMDGDEYDEEYEVITNESHWLGGEEWNKDMFDHQEEMAKLYDTQKDKLIDKLNSLLSFANSIMQANKQNYKDVVRYALENYPTLLKNKMPELYQSISVSVDFSSMANIEFWEKRDETLHDGWEKL